MFFARSEAARFMRPPVIDCPNEPSHVGIELNRRSIRRGGDMSAPSEEKGRGQVALLAPTYVQHPSQDAASEPTQRGGKHHDADDEPADDGAYGDDAQMMGMMPR